MSNVRLIVDSEAGLFECDYPNCGKAFTRKDHLVRHAANHSDIVHYCPTCDRGFKRLDLLQRHQIRKVCGGQNSHQRPGHPDETSRSERDQDDERSNDSETSVGGTRRGKRLRVDLGPSVPLQPPLHRQSLPNYDFATQSYATSSSIPLAFHQQHPDPPPPLHQPTPGDHPMTSPLNPSLHQFEAMDMHLDGAFQGSHQPFQSKSESFSPHLVDLPAPYPLSAPSAMETSGALPAEPGSLSSASSHLPDFEVVPHPVWGYTNAQVFYPPPWELPMHDSAEMAPPFNQDPFSIDLSSYNVPPVSTPRPQESSERVVETVQTIASPGVFHRLDLQFPELQGGMQWLNNALESYWTNVSPSFPFIHRGTFDIHQAPPALIVMMAITGSVHLSLPRGEYANTVMEIRGGLIQECGLDMPISTLQTFCLCHVYDTYYGTAESLFVAQCMWPVMVAHSRKKGIGVLAPPDMDEMPQEEAWATWAKDEETRRAAFCVLMIDTQLSAFWNQHPSRQLSIFAHNIALPCSRNQWEALTPGEWIRQRKLDASRRHAKAAASGAQQGAANATRPPGSAGSGSGRALYTHRSPTKQSRSSYLPGLHPDFEVKAIHGEYSAVVFSALASEARLPLHIDADNALAVEMVLMGVMAVAWDCRTRGGMGLKFREGTKQWRPLVLNAVINLRAGWENAVQSSRPTVETRDMRDIFAISIISVLSDIPMLQVAAGATSVCGTTIRSRQYRDAQRRLRIWATSEDAWTCLWQSARYLRSALWASWGIYTPWAVYITTLVHWGYAWAHLPPATHLPRCGPDPGSRSVALFDSILISPGRLSKIEHLGVLDLVASTADRLRSACGNTGFIAECADLLTRLLGGGAPRAHSEEDTSGSMTTTSGSGFVSQTDAPAGTGVF